MKDYHWFLPEFDFWVLSLEVSESNHMGGCAENCANQKGCVPDHGRCVSLVVDDFDILIMKGERPPDQSTGLVLVTV